ncbi:MAG: PA domain-containing protein [Acidimicrobiales bacterium]
MHRRIQRLVVAFVAITVLASSSVAGARPIEAVETFDYTRNMHPLGFSERSVPLTGEGSGIFNSDIAFWGNHAFQGSYEGFRIIDIRSPARPREVVNFTDCVEGTTIANQGDVVIWDDVLVRSWNSPAPAEGAFCGGVFVPPGQEGVHVFDISDRANPVGLTFVSTLCGSHTASGVPDLDHNRLLIYNSPSSGAPGCRGIDIIEVPLDDPASAAYLRFLPSGEPSGPFVTVDPPSSAAGDYGAAEATFGPPAPEAGVPGDIVLVDDGTDVPTDACEPLVGFPAGAIALLDRGICTFVQKVNNAQDAGAVAVIVANNVPGPPINMGGDDPGVVISSVMVSLADGDTIKAGLPATGAVSSLPQPDQPDRSCHDTGVILGDVNLAACAGGDGFSVWSLDSADGGSREDPAFLYSQAIEGVAIGHSAGFTWDGEVLVYGHEPGGGGQPECQATSDEVNKTVFFFEPRGGELLGTFLHQRPQTETENCTWHNYNVVPTDKGYVLVSGNYQSGISVVDFTDPANAREIAHADPAPLSDTELITGGDWSTYWYNGRIYESDIRRGLIIWKLSDAAVAGARKLDHANPQTQETSFPLGRG